MPPTWISVGATPVDVKPVMGGTVTFGSVACVAPLGPEVVVVATAAPVALAAVVVGAVLFLLLLHAPSTSKPATAPATPRLNQATVDPPPGNLPLLTTVVGPDGPVNDTGRVVTGSPHLPGGLPWVRGRRHRHPGRDAHRRHGLTGAG